MGQVLRIATIIIQAEEDDSPGVQIRPPDDQELADQIADFPMLRGEVQVLSSFETKADNINLE